MAKSFKDFFKPFLEKKNPSVLGIDIGSSSIKVVQVRKSNGQAVLETYGELALGPYGGLEVGQSTKLPVEKIVEALIDVLKEANASTIECAISIPMRSSMVSVIKMPAMDSKQLPKMIPIEARKYIPVPISEVTLDWFVIPKSSNSDEDEEGSEEVSKNKRETSEVLVVAIHNDVLNNYNSIISGAGLNAKFFEIEMFSTIRSVLEAGNNQPVMICDIGSGVTKLYIVERGVVRDSHIINRGSQDITMNIAKSMEIDFTFAEKLKRNYGKNTPDQDEKIKSIIDLMISPILSDTNTVLVNFQKKSNKNVSEVIVVGGGAMLGGVIETAQEKLSITARAGDPFSLLESPEFLKDVLQKTGFSFATAIGLAIRELQDM